MTPRSAAAPAKPARRGLTSLAAQVARVAGPVLRKHGTAAFRLRAEWPRVVGDELAAVSMPETLTAGALQLKVESAAALLVQHQERQVIERINAYLGRDAVQRLRIVQGPVPRPPRPAARPAAAAAPDPGLEARLARDIDDDDLRAALASLGRAVGGRDGTS